MLAISLGRLLFVLGVVAAAAASADERPTPNQAGLMSRASATSLERIRITGRSEALVKQAIISLIAAESSGAVDMSKEESSKLTWDVGQLLLMFDRTERPSEIEMLSSLVPYYIGEANGEVLQCIVLRIGKPMRPFLSKLQNSESDECIGRFGVGAPHSNTSPIVCLRPAEYRSRLNELIGAIDRGDSCDDSELE